MKGRGTAARAALVWVTATAGAGLVVGWLRPDRVLVSGRPETFEALLAAGGTVLGTLCVVWLWIGTGVTALEAVGQPGPGRQATGQRRRGRWGGPLMLRRVVLAACGVALASGVAAPGQAASPAAADPAERASGVPKRAAQVVAGLPLPDRTLGGSPPRSRLGQDVGRTAAGRPVQTQEPEMVVALGDTLWEVAARLLPDTAPAAAIDALWRRIYQANRHVIGTDPNLLLPGQVLRVPRTAEAAPADLLPEARR